ncbi:hypothetical protein FKG94_02780 [Exilibacterium tricleocarpae]|uniref:Uncharacterized protein n=1 Tax=Exilibacterium tricleocarpae TaxID=2591008 RepID=A0A545U6N2_9GAMM|nr:hypothetical protein [Exilibacterium tricleocarpae]TQV85131.1 hypothetical protein FKG94_02780 [Exilibacterium tricleocarpae]
MAADGLVDGTGFDGGNPLLCIVGEQQLVVRDTALAKTKLRFIQTSVMVEGEMGLGSGLFRRLQFDDAGYHQSQIDACTDLRLVFNRTVINTAGAITFITENIREGKAQAGENTEPGARVITAKSHVIVSLVALLSTQKNRLINKLW